MKKKLIKLYKNIKKNKEFVKKINSFEKDIEEKICNKCINRFKKSKNVISDAAKGKFCRSCNKIINQAAVNLWNKNQGE